MPATVDALKIHLGLSGASTVDDQAMQDAVDAANDTATVYRPDLTVDANGDTYAVWPAGIDKGAVMLAARLYGRRGSVTGIAAYTDIGVAMLGRLDPDVRLLWELGEFQGPVIA